jgi:hypothetical protein
MAWFDEMIQLFRRPIGEIGFAFLVREKMHNELVISSDELRQILGAEWQTVVENLRKAGIMTVEMVGKNYKLSVVAPGDKKRARCRAIGRKNRSFSKFEKSILKENSDEKND